MLKGFRKFFGAAFTAMLFMAMPCGAQQPSAPATSEGDFVIHNFQFHSGESLPELRLHYTTLGKPEKDAAGHTTNAVLVLHGTGGTGHQFLQPQFAKLPFGAWQRLARSRYFIFFPQGIRHGKTSKPRDRPHTPC